MKHSKIEEDLSTFLLIKGKRARKVTNMGPFGTKF